MKRFSGYLVLWIGLNLMSGYVWSQPNIIWFVVEDIGCYLGCYGDTVAITPNLDKLASEGVLFTNVYSTAGVCAPSRSALITGCYPSAIGTNNMRVVGGSKPEGLTPYDPVVPGYVRTFTEYLRKGGYFCMNSGKKDYQFEAPRSSWDILGSGAIDWDNAPDGQPFFLLKNGFMITHESSIWGNASHPQLVHPDSVNVPPYYPDNSIIRKDIARNYSNIAAMDLMIGNYMGELESKGYLDNSIIVFLSDHGGPLPRQKRELYDSGLKVPMIIRFPDQSHAGIVVDDLISFVDLGPTMLSLAGIQIPDSMHGQAFWGTQKADEREYIFAARDRMDTEYDIRRAVRDKRYKYIRNYKPEIGSYQNIAYRLNMPMMVELLRLRDAGELNEQQMIWFRTSKPEEELYDTWTDPHELINLADSSTYEDILIRMRNQHNTFQASYFDFGFTPEIEWVNQWWPGGVQPVTSDPEFERLSNSYLIISCKEADASVSYQIVDADQQFDPDWSAWKVFEDSVYVTANQTIYAVAHRIGYLESGITGFGVAAEALEEIQSFSLQKDASKLTNYLLQTAGVINVVDSNLFVYKNFIEGNIPVDNVQDLQTLVDLANVFAEIVYYASIDNASELSVMQFIALGVKFRTDRMEYYKNEIANATPEDLKTIDDLQYLIDHVIINTTIFPSNNVFRVYPNPVKDMLFIYGSADLNQILKIEISDLEGRIFTVPQPDLDFKIDLSFICNGIYMLIITTINETHTMKFIKN